MPIEANYETYYAIDLDHYTTTWGGNSYTKLLVREYMDSDLTSTASTENTDITFIYPRLITNKTYLDGVAEGHVTFYNNGDGAYDLETFTISLQSTIDAPSSATTLGSYTATYSSGTNMAQNGFLTVPFFMNITKKSLNENEKLLLRIQHSAGTTEMAVSHENDSTLEDVKIKIPFSAAL